MSVQAISKGVRMSPRKVGVVASLVRGRTVTDALTILEHTRRVAADPVIRVIKSARSNAEHNHQYKPDSLYISEIQVTPGPRMKRIRPAARGSANRYQLRSSHIRVIVEGEKRVTKKPVVSSKSTAKETK